MRLQSLILTAMLLIPHIAAAQFEGEISTKITTRHSGGGSGKLYLSKLGTRNEIDFNSPKLQGVSTGPYRIVTIQKFAEPDLVYHLNEERKTYSILDLKKIGNQTKGFNDETYTVKRLGVDTVAGYACEKALLSSQHGTETEMCIAKSIRGMEAWVTMMERTAQVKSGMFKALKDAGLEGLPVKMIMRRKGEDSPIMTMEVVQAEQKPLSVTLFEVPSSYQKEDIISSFATPEMAEKLNGFMNKMTPEQRKIYEGMKNRMMGR